MITKANCKKKTAKNNPSAAALRNSSYAVKGSRNRKPNRKIEARVMDKGTREAGKTIEKGQEMAQIEAYAKEHNCTITQAMIAFM